VNPAGRTAMAVALRRVLAARKNAQDLIDVGAYKAGANPLVDAALSHEVAINAFLQQRMDDQTPDVDAWSSLEHLTRILGGA
jgi:flagellum-specific ATP synthase